MGVAACLTLRMTEDTDRLGRRYISHCPGASRLRRLRGPSSKPMQGKNGSHGMWADGERRGLSVPNTSQELSQRMAGRRDGPFMAGNAVGEENAAFSRVDILPRPETEHRYISQGAC